MTTQTLKSTLSSVIDGVKSNPHDARITFEADTRILEGLRCEATIREFRINIDEPETLGGTDTAPNPVEMLLASLGACQEIVYTAYAAMMDIPIHSVEVKVKGKLDLRGLFGLDPAIHAGFPEIDFETTIVSPAPEAQIQQLREMVERHCPVMDTLMRPIPVRGNVIIKEPAVLPAL